MASGEVRSRAAISVEESQPWARSPLCVNVAETITPSEIREGGEARNW